jgi:hypothetical protein
VDAAQKTISAALVVPRHAPQQRLVNCLERLAAMLYPVEAADILGVLLNELRNAVQARREGIPYEEAKGYAWRRAEWRVRLALLIRRGWTCLAGVFPARLPAR